MAKKKIKEFHVGKAQIFSNYWCVCNKEVIRLLPMVVGLLMQNISYSVMAFALTCMWTML
jgi:hypothetical protein